MWNISESTDVKQMEIETKGKNNTVKRSRMFLFVVWEIFIL